jgi:hypothetical protein
MDKDTKLAVTGAVLISLGAAALLKHPVGLLAGPIVYTAAYIAKKWPSFGKAAREITECASVQTEPAPEEKNADQNGFSVRLKITRDPSLTFLRISTKKKDPPGNNL